MKYTATIKMLSKPYYFLAFLPSVYNHAGLVISQWPRGNPRFLGKSVLSTARWWVVAEGCRQWRSETGTCIWCCTKNLPLETALVARCRLKGKLHKRCFSRSCSAGWKSAIQIRNRECSPWKKTFEWFSLTTAWRVNFKEREECKLIVDQSAQTRSGQIQQSSRDQSNHQDVFAAEPSGNSQQPLSNRLGNANFS